MFPAHKKLSLSPPITYGALVLLHALINRQPYQTKCPALMYRLQKWEGVTTVSYGSHFSLITTVARNFQEFMLVFPMLQAKSGAM